MPFKMGPWEIALILVIILIVFGVGKLPQVGSAIGKGIRSFKKSSAGEDEEDEDKETAAAAPKKTTRNKTTRKKAAKS
jgi:sec-independent protein translocase protein TatA